MEKVKKAIEEIVNREIRAWDTQDVELFLSCFHPDFVWIWPPAPDAHDPKDWLIEQGRFNYERWKDDYQKLFDSNKLVHNYRKLTTIQVSKEKDGAFAVTDIDTLWENRSTGEQMHWKGRTCKVFALMENGEWKITMHTGALNYS